MKANLTARALAASILVMALSHACAPQRVELTPPPAPAAVSRPPLPPAPPRPVVDWRDAPITPGDWKWAMEGNSSVARFAGGQLVLGCDRAGGTVTLLRAGSGDHLSGSEVPMTILTSSLTRSLAGIADAGPPPVVAATLAARDSLLDAMAFSRGRFAVEMVGLPTLYVPSWPEVSRVVEDCRQGESPVQANGAKPQF